MSHTVAIEQERLQQLNDQLWRRLGITQTFDRLLVEVTAGQPGPVNDVRDNVAESLAEGAAKFWAMSFANIKKDLCRRKVLAESDGAIHLHEDFAERLERILHDMDEGVSHVEPTPGMTLEEVQARTQEREEREKAEKATRSRTTTPTARVSRASATPKKRRSGEEEAVPARPRPKTPAAAAAPLDPVAIFTSKRINDLLDRLQAGALYKNQLASKLGLGTRELERFVEVAANLELVRLTRDDMVELHFKGREYSITSGVDRRTTVRKLVAETRAAAEAE